MIYKTNRYQKNHSPLKFIHSIPLIPKVLLFLLLAATMFVAVYGPDRALWIAKSRITSIIRPTGYAKPFIDPIFKSSEQKNAEKEISFKVGFVSDSHSDTIYYPEILKKITEEKVDFIVHMGDTVNAGSIQDLDSAKTELEQTGITYYNVCGNHDHNFWPVRETKNYQAVFGKTYHSFSYKDAHFTILNDSSEFNGVDEEQMNWFRQDVSTNTSNLKFLLMHIPPYHPYLAHTMKSGEENIQAQADQLLQITAENKVNEIFSGHLHSFSRFIEPKSRVKITVVGSAGSERNMVPSFAILTVYKDQTYQIEDRVLEEK